MNNRYQAFYKLLLFKFFTFSLFIGIFGCQNSGSPFSRAAREAIQTFELPPGFQIELVASEPMVSDPVAIEFDEYGRLYAVEMHGYPLDKSGTGKIKLLQDTDGDGKMDKSTVFAEDLMLPTGIMRWKQGVLVTDPPNVLYLADTTGDGRADLRKKVLTGFAVSNPQHIVNTPKYGLDNWIYLGHEEAVTAKVYKEAFGDQGSDIYFPEHPGSPRLPDNGRGRSIRFRPDDHQLENLSAKTQFGYTFDQWGHHFMVNNSNHIYQNVLAASYLNRNPDLPVANTTSSISDHGNAAEVYPITKDPQKALLTDVGVFTSACGLTWYSGQLFPPEFDSVTFVAEPVSNLVHADGIKSKGASFTASRLYENREFLASTDSWFRPVNTYVGPDGALYVVDYYRQYIEHPEWMAEEVIQSGDLYNGMDKGRIYRITPENSNPSIAAGNINLGTASDETLVQKLAHTNLWWRRHAQRLLVDRQNKENIPDLEQMAGNSGSSVGRLHALWTLQGLNQLSPEIIKNALQDPEPGIRENAIKLAELHLSNDPDLAQSLVAMQDDPNAKVRFQLLCTLGFLNSSEAARAREKILFRDIDDPWIQIAALTASSIRSQHLLTAVLEHFREQNLAYATLVKRLSAMAGKSGDLDEIKHWIREGLKGTGDSRGSWQTPVLEGIAQGLTKDMNFQGMEKEQSLILDAYFKHPSQPVRDAGLAILEKSGLPGNSATEKALTEAQQIASNGEETSEKRVDAINLLAIDGASQYQGLMEKLINPQESQPVRLAATQAYMDMPGQEVCQNLLAKWTKLTPAVRNVALDGFLQNEDRIKLLLDAMESGTIKKTSIGWSRSVQLMSQANDELRKRSRTLLAQQGENRKEVIQDYQSVLDLEGNLENGKIVYQENCARCHQMGNIEGVPFGPDLSTIRNRPKKSIMADILDPNLSIADGYDLWQVQLQSGETLQGVIASETNSAITLRNQLGEDNTVAHDNIQSMQPMEMSVMPAGLENQISKQEMADLLAFIKK